MNKQDFVNAKWDVRDWTDAMKRKWQEQMFKLGFFWAGGLREVNHFEAFYYYIYENGAITHNDDEEYFEGHPHGERSYYSVFPEIEQGQKHDGEKPRYDLLPPVAIDEMAKVMTFGAQKYAPDNWRHVDNAVERYRAALLRHSFAMLRGEELDPETGLPHAAHAMCCAAFLVELEA